jgi:hypothetical protein
MRRLLELKVKYGHTKGLLYRRKKGRPTKMGDFDEPLIERLVWIQENTQGLIPMTIDLWDVVGCRRSTRRKATTEALHMEVDASWIDMLQNLKHELKFSLAI